MTENEIIALWRQHKEVMGFAIALINEEREECAKMFESLFDDPNDSVLAFIVDAIRARGNT